MVSKYFCEVTQSKSLRHATCSHSASLVGQKQGQTHFSSSKFRSRIGHEIEKGEKKNSDNENEMELTSALTEHMWSCKGLAEENINETGSKNEICGADFSFSPLTKKKKKCDVHMPSHLQTANASALGSETYLLLTSQR